MPTNLRAKRQPAHSLEKPSSREQAWKPAARERKISTRCTGHDRRKHAGETPRCRQPGAAQRCLRHLIRTSAAPVSCSYCFTGTRAVAIASPGPALASSHALASRSALRQIPWARRANDIAATERHSQWAAASRFMPDPRAARNCSRRPIPRRERVHVARLIHAQQLGSSPPRVALGHPSPDGSTAICSSLSAAEPIGHRAAVARRKSGRFPRKFWRQMTLAKSVSLAESARHP